MVAAFRPTRRLALALGLSLLTHVLIVGNWGDFSGDRRVPRWQVEARLEAPGASVSDPEASPPHTPVATVTPASPGGVRMASEAGSRKHQKSAALPPSNGGGADRHFYSARELDHYPEPLNRQELLAGAAPAVRVWVSIDREGVVREVAAADMGGSAEAARERLLTVRFLPARRAGLPVNSRVLMELPGR